MVGAKSRSGCGLVAERLSREAIPLDGRNDCRATASAALPRSETQPSWCYRLTRATGRCKPKLPADVLNSNVPASFAVATDWDGKKSVPSPMRVARWADHKLAC